MKSQLSAKQIKAYQLCSGELCGMTTVEAAADMGISVQAVNRLLARAEQRCPELFPLLTKQEAHVRDLMDNHGHSNRFIALRLGLSEQRISQISVSIDDKLGRRDQPIVMERYESHLDSKVVRRF